MQVEGRQQGRPVHEMLAVARRAAGFRLASPSPGDIFFDLEGDPFVGVRRTGISVRIRGGGR